MRQLRIRGSHQRAYYVLQNTCSFLVLGSPRLPPDFTGSVVERGDSQGYLEGSSGEAQGRGQRAYSPRMLLYLTVEVTILMTFLGNGAAACQRWVSSHSVCGHLG